MLRSKQVELAKEVVNSKGDKVKVANITEPTGLDLEELGNPIMRAGEGEVSINFKIGAQYVERCIDVPMEVIRSQPSRVMNDCVGVIIDFLVNP